MRTSHCPVGEIRSQLAFASFADGFESFDVFDWSASVPQEEQKEATAP